MAELFGSWPALVTPFTADNQVNPAAIEKLVQYHLDKGVNGFYSCGSTGYGVFQSVAERKLVTETIINTVQGRVPVIVHVGAVALPDAIELARHACERGAAGFSSIIPPLYDGMAGIIAYYEALANAVPELGFFPYLARPEVNALELVKQLISLPNVVGTKYTGPNMHEFGQITALRNDNWTVFSGMDEQSVFAAMSCSSGHIGSTLNYMPGAYARIRTLVTQGHHAQAIELQNRVNVVTRQLLTAGFFGALYETLRMLGIDCGEPRLPSVPLSREGKAALRASLDNADFWNLVAM